ncbi:MAG: NAD-binding protein, partial [Eubacterium sp.]
MNITIIGAGKLGIKLAESLAEENHNVTVVDINESKVNKIVESYDVQGVYGSATQCEVLRESDIKNCDLLIATTPSDENNILSCLIGRRMGAKNTIARVRNPEYSAQINFMRDELGISMMINPDFAAALEIFKILQFPSVVNVESFANGNIDIVGIKLRKESSVCDKKI